MVAKQIPLYHPYNLHLFYFYSLNIYMYSIRSRQISLCPLQDAI
ncbi:hypothetical protein EFW58_01155 [Bacillus velezensis]|nr:hypothetical protein EFW58_01155 [Bacillus velezensis]